VAASVVGVGVRHECEVALRHGIEPEAVADQ
jgi:hypothetical protein